MTHAARCPRCAVAFEPFSLDGATTLDLCPRCNGAWFDRGELAQLLGTHRDFADVDDELLPAAPDAPLCPRCPGVCLVARPFTRAATAPTLLHCPYCEGNFAKLPDLAAMRTLAAAQPRMRPRTPAVTHDDPPPAVTAPTEAPAPAYVDPDAQTYTPMTLREALAAVPVTFAVVALVNGSGFGRILMHGARVSLHEFGHASVAWACGNMSIPLPIGVTFTTPGRSFTMVALVLAGSLGGVWLGVKHRAPALAVSTGAYGLAAMALTWAVPERTQRMLQIAGGCGGEMVWGATLVVLAHFAMPEKLAWARFRWVALAIGACSFVSAAIFWREAAADWELIPWDAALADTGDMTHLRDDYGWNELRITQRYTRLSYVCLAAVALAQLSAVWRAWRAGGRLRAGATTGSPRA